MVYFNACPRCQKKLDHQQSYCKACGLPLNERTLENLNRQKTAELLQHKENLGYSSAFTYPLRGSGLSLLIIGTLFLGFVGLLPLGWLFRLMGSGYMMAFMFKIIVETARGNLEPIEWPGVSNIFDDIVRPFFRMTFVNVFCFAPTFLALYFGVGGFEGLANLNFATAASTLLLAGLLFLGGLVYLPLALLSVAMNDSFLGVHPGIVVRLLHHLGGEYAGVLAVLLASIVLEGFCGKILGAIPILGGLMLSFIGLYFTMVNMHVIGLIYYKHREKMGG